jgi:hypothetical protein
LRIDRDQRDAFNQLPDSHTPQRWVGRSVEARGWIVDRKPRGQSPSRYKRFMLPIRHPFMLEID